VQKRAQRQVRPGLAGTQQASAQRKSYRYVLKVLAFLFLD